MEEEVSYHDEARLLRNGDHKVQADKYSQIMYLVKVFATKCRKALESMESDCSENPSVLENRGFPVKRTKKRTNMWHALNSPAPADFDLQLYNVIFVCTCACV